MCFSFFFFFFQKKTIELFLKLSFHVVFNEGLTQAALIWHFETLTWPAVINVEKIVLWLCLNLSDIAAVCIPSI